MNVRASHLPRILAAGGIASIAGIVGAWSLPNALAGPPQSGEGLSPAELGRVGAVVAGLLLLLALGAWRRWMVALGLAGCGTMVGAVIAGIWLLAILVGGESPRLDRLVPTAAAALLFGGSALGVYLTLRQIADDQGPSVGSSDEPRPAPR